jgi:hypothetical protein
VVPLLLVGLGLFGVGSAIQALRVGEVGWIWSTLGGWGRLS